MTLKTIKKAAEVAKAWAKLYGIFNDAEGIKFIGLAPRVDYQGKAVTHADVHVDGVDVIARTAGTRLYGRKFGRETPHTDTVVDGVIFYHPIYRVKEVAR